MNALNQLNIGLNFDKRNSNNNNYNNDMFRATKVVFI
jgi:hypothetical protein